MSKVIELIKEVKDVLLCDSRTYKYKLDVLPTLRITPDHKDELSTCYNASL